MIDITSTTPDGAEASPFAASHNWRNWLFPICRRLSAMAVCGTLRLHLHLHLYCAAA
jgi:hypothetical protein